MRQGEVRSAPVESYERQEVLTELLAFEAPYLEERCLIKEIVGSKAEYDLLFTEVKKYLWLAVNHETNLTMFSLRVDEVWHQFILFTRQYSEFCERFFGKYVHHLPESSFIPRNRTPREEFETIYGANLGSVPSVWKEDVFGETCGPTGSCRN